MNAQETQNTAQSDRRNRRERRRARRGGSPVAGVVLIALGFLIFLQAQGYVTLGKWGSLLILIPAVAAFVNAGNEYRKAGNQINRQTSVSLLGGLILTAITAAILFGLDWGLVGSALLILLGIAIFFRSPQSA